MRQRRPIPSPNHLAGAIVASKEDLHSDRSDTGAVPKPHIILQESFLVSRTWRTHLMVLNTR